MNRKLILENGQRLKATVPFAGAPYVEADVPCPACDKPAPVRVRGTEPKIGLDVVEGKALAVCCRRVVGRLVATYDYNDTRALDQIWWDTDA